MVLKSNSHDWSRSLDAVYARAFATFDGAMESPVLLAEAEDATGLTDWGRERWAEDGFRARLQALCAALESEAQLTALGRTRAHCRLHVMLCSRLRFIAWYQQQGELAPIVAPLIGTGFPRSGTSFLHELIAQDPDHLYPITAVAAIPVPPPGVLRDEAERMALENRLLAFQGLDSPEVNGIHPFAPDAADECVTLQEAACGSLYQAFFNVPSYMGELANSVADIYQWQKGMMQVLQQNQTANRWVLKTPEHMQNWPHMLDTFPGCKIFLNHRDPAKVVASIASLFLTFQGLNSTGAVDPKYLGEPMLANLMNTMNQVSQWRKSHPEVPVVDVHYQQLIADPIAEVARVYSAFGMQLTVTAEQRMADFLKINRHGQGVRHSYQLADFGLSEAIIEETCGAYIDKYSVVRESRV